MQRFLRSNHGDSFAGERSFLYGRSTTSQRIEGWWAILRKQSAEFWINFFQTLISDGHFLDKIFLHASNNDCSSTVLDCFLNALAKYREPTRVRTDHEGENNAVWVMMNIFRGLGRGRSTHNQHIERLWGDMWQALTNVYHNLFESRCTGHRQ
ncbi:hypothetical protein H4Q32_027044 [Labeo rohita]|uniref:Integrase core domain-containing protein n=1 Tax=Labeo rohita TaxID=84645 RepID=A0ABQ8L4W8_LABRO|nr:hypothetical protein H4Q32_027044 [Labeo rohita]